MLHLSPSPNRQCTGDSLHLYIIYIVRPRISDREERLNQSPPQTVIHKLCAVCVLWNSTGSCGMQSVLFHNNRISYCNHHEPDPVKLFCFVGAIIEDYVANTKPGISDLHSKTTEVIFSCHDVSQGLLGLTGIH